MDSRAAITVNHPRDEVERLWRSADHPAPDGADVTFKDAPGDRGTEIHVDLAGASGSALGGAVRRLTGGDPLAKVKDDLRRFKQQVETGEVAVAAGTPREKAGV